MVGAYYYLSGDAITEVIILSQRAECDCTQWPPDGSLGESPKCLTDLMDLFKHRPYSVNKTIMYKSLVRLLMTAVPQQILNKEPGCAEDTQESPVPCFWISNKDTTKEIFRLINGRPECVEKFDMSNCFNMFYIIRWLVVV